MKKPYGIHWFRRDLRMGGNPAMGENYLRSEGRVLGVFCFDRAFLSRKDFSPRRFRFFLKTLLELKKELREAGGDLLVLDEGPFLAFKALFSYLQKHPWGLPSTVTWNRDYEPFARERDARMEDFFRDHSVPVLTQNDHLLIEPQEVYKTTPEEGYQIYTPFSRRWLERFSMPEVQHKIAQQKKGLALLRKRIAGQGEPILHLTWSQFWGGPGPLKDALEEYTKRYDAGQPDLPPAGAKAALRALESFASKTDGYETHRDFPERTATSQLSIYLKNGSLTIAQIIAELDLRVYDKGSKDGRAKYFSELIWREFYYHILYRTPSVEHHAFLSRYENLAFENRIDWFERWKTGTTGFPIVDAGMRQLQETGWMHNRVRMIVASFLTKDLLIDWKWGEQHFMKELLDGDLAPNNGGWQWAASTGCDAQPYFRIFNPWSQSAKFDPEGHYIRRHIPELASAHAKDLHHPDGARPDTYPKPIVDHAVQRKRALMLYAR